MISTKSVIPAVMLSLSFLTANAAPLTPGGLGRGAGDVVGDLLQFFKGLFTGSAQTEDAYLLSLILYFIIFLAVFLEGLRFTPIFGEKGTVNKQGKFFAIAASILATIAIFMVEQSSGISSIERLPYLLAPFGVWGGLILAGVFAFMTYRFMADSGVFGEQVVVPVAFAAALGVTLLGFVFTMENLIGWGFLIMAILLAIGLIRALPASEEQPARHEEREAQEDTHHRDRERARRRRENVMRHPQAELIQAIEQGRDLVQAVPRGLHADTRQQAVRDMEQGLAQLRRHLRNAVHDLRIARRRERGDTYRALDRLYAQTGVALSIAEHLRVPTGQEHDPFWGNENQGDQIRRNFIESANQVMHTTSVVLNEVNSFQEHEDHLARVEAQAHQQRQRENAAAQQRREQQEGEEAARRQAQGQRQNQGNRD